MPDLLDGETRAVPGTGRTWEIKNVGGVYSCNCPAWRNQSVNPNHRTCKHLQRFRGVNAEMIRISSPSGVAPRPWNPPAVPAPTPAQVRAGRAAAKVPSFTTPGGRAIQHPTSVVVRPAAPAAPVNAWGRLAGHDSIFDDEPEPEPIVVAPPAIVTPEAPEDLGDYLRAEKFAVLLAESWDGVTDPTGWWMSEKLDGVRAYWDGENFISRLGNVFAVPDDYRGVMPKGMHLDGEFWMGRGQFQKTSGAVRRQDRGRQWNDIQYMVFDAPNAQGGFEDRQETLRSRAPKHGFKVVQQDFCTGIASLRSRLEAIERLGGEGLMLRRAKSLYERCRSGTLLKVKTFHDAEARVAGYTAGKGKHRGRVGALQCVFPENVTIRLSGGRTIEMVRGVKFDVGTGLSDAERANPPRIGSTITFRFQELTRDGVPRFPSYLRVSPGW